MLDLIPSALLEHVCAFLDASTLGQLELASNHEIQSLMNRSSLWATLVARRFGLTDLPKFAAKDGNKLTLVRWKRVFGSAQQDAKALKFAVSDADALITCNNLSLELQPREARIRRELMLMQALRKFPTSDAIVSLYACELLNSGWKPRTATPSATKTSRGRSGLIAPVAPASPRYARQFIAPGHRGC